MEQDLELSPSGQHCALIMSLFGRGWVTVVLRAEMWAGIGGHPGGSQPQGFPLPGKANRSPDGTAVGTETFWGLGLSPARQLFSWRQDRDREQSRAVCSGTGPSPGSQHQFEISRKWVPAEWRPRLRPVDDLQRLPIGRQAQWARPPFLDSPWSARMERRAHTVVP